MVAIVFSSLIFIAAVVTAIILNISKKTTYKKDKWGDIIYDSSNNPVVETESAIPKKYVWLTAIGGIALSIIIIVLSMIQTIPTGHTGIVTTFGRVETQTLEAGVHFKAPYQNVIKMDNRVQRSTLQLSCFSSDLQEVDVGYTVNYQINKQNASEIYRTIGKEYYDTIISPTINDSVKTVIGRYTAEDLIASRTQVQIEIEEFLANNLKKYNIEISSTAIENMDFTDTFTNAVEAKQVAAQKKLQSEIEQAQKVMEKEALAQMQIIEAEANAEAAKIKAQADLEIIKIEADGVEYAGQKEAAANKAIAESITESLVNYNYINAWNGELPSTYVGSENVSTILNNK